MKTLIFNGSPRKQGDTRFMIDYLSERLSGEVHVIDAYTCGVKSCVDCRYCWTHPHCVFPDFQELDDRIRSCDNIILASPIYFSEVTGELLRVLSKVQVYWSARFLRQETLFPNPKKGALLLAYAGHCNLIYPEHSCHILLKNMGVQSIWPTVTASDTDRVPAREDQGIHRALDELALFLNGSVEPPVRP
ncbi:flavodoxin family protein [Proteiniclasticum sp. QWL-01]|uniref:flavodoxin family protein n=1 Tax=Proteiniclasticum sp. QWL-01 TaxID=3036945 RepID=UPI0024117F0F|nr:flavodoxin family protein [Proteiniclasticum sp. QWL-01]WFF74193.1 flavodoxin family protein [Proteiniclasticum sp. QWL-01]